MRLALAASLMLLAGCRAASDGRDGGSPRPQGTVAPDTGSGSAGPGDADERVEVRFQAPYARREDIVFVIDNSRSMADHRADLGASMQTLLDVLDDGGIDWHVGVTTVDVETAGMHARVA